ncbi:hypothetical protein V5799_012986 [Amblyomma americanum]|uniref:Uncharacterized protein n=1 Tax=Amblyomma americanum TaxID=6943 RepID=A0AAQ4E778_AMBAM
MERGWHETTGNGWLPVLCLHCERTQDAHRNNVTNGLDGYTLEKVKRKLEAPLILKTPQNTGNDGYTCDHALENGSAPFCEICGQLLDGSVHRGMHEPPRVHSTDEQRSVVRPLHGQFRRAQKRRLVAQNCRHGNDKFNGFRTRSHSA